MKIVRNKIFPFKGYKAMVIWPFVFVRKDAIYRDVDARHEAIHGEQQKEMLIVFFLLWYGIEWIVKLIKYRNKVTAYKNISFEREAYDKQSKVGYLEDRTPYAWWGYL